MSATLAEINNHLFGASGVSGVVGGTDGTSPPALAETFDNQDFVNGQMI